MQNPVEPDQNAVVTKYSVVPQKESDSLGAWASFVKFLGRNLADIPLYFMKNFYKGKVAQVENTATATLLEAQGVYAERIAKAEKTREETRALRIKNDGEERNQKEQELLEAVKMAMAMIATKGGAVELNTPATPELKTILATMMAREQSDKAQVAVTMGRPDQSIILEAVTMSIVEPAKTTPGIVPPAEPEFREPTPQEPERKEPPSAPPPTFGMGIGIGI
jgi:hypothetical protein